jgi:hypothetical protein
MNNRGLKLYQLIRRDEFSLVPPDSFYSTVKTLLVDRRKLSEFCRKPFSGANPMKTFLLMTFCLFAASPALAQTPLPSPCANQPEFRQFDFWVGEWDVTVQGKPAGTNSVQLILDKCVVFENWTGARGLNGKSFNVYHAAKKQWQQFWVDSGGNVLELAGQFKDGVMTLQGETSTAQGKVLQRLTFTPLPESRVRQVWESSADAGKTWSVAFDGLYTRKPAAASKE